MKLVFLAIGIALIAVSFQNCGEPFAVADVTVAVQESVDVGVLPSVNYPKLKFETSQCFAGSICEIKIVADRALESEVKASWQTNDTAWESQPSLYAQPNVHYIPAMGIFKIAAGESSTSIRINSINWGGSSNGIITYSIPLKINGCTIAQQSTSCRPFF